MLVFSSVSERIFATRKRLQSYGAFLSLPKSQQCLTLFNLSAPRLACRRRHFRKASAKVRPFSSTAKFFRTFFRGFFAKTGPRTPKTLSFHNIAQLIFFMRATEAMGIMGTTEIMGTLSVYCFLAETFPSSFAEFFRYFS